MKLIILFSLVAIFFPMTISMSISDVRKFEFYSAKYRWMNKNIYSIVIEESRRMKADPKLIFAIINAESNGKRTARSSVGALGLMQVMPANYKGPKEDLLNQRINVRTGINVFKMWKRHAKGNLVLALNHYQRGFISGANIKYIAKITNDYWTSI